MSVVFPDHDRPTNAVRFHHAILREKRDRTSAELL